MRNVLLSAVFATLLLSPSVIASPSSGNPKIEEMQLVAQLPAELPQRIMGLAFDGQKFWATIYLDRGRYATLDPSTLAWDVNNRDEQLMVIKEVSGAFGTPGGICFAQGKLWVAGAYGESFGSIETRDWKVGRIFKGKQREDAASQFYSSMAYDGSHLWIAWHWFNYVLPVSQTQLLLKVDPGTGRVIGAYPAPAGTRNDGTHGLTWDGARLWHSKDNRLSSLDPSTGRVTAQYTLKQLKRPSGLAWDGQALWIAEFDGKIWRVPF